MSDQTTASRPEGLTHAFRRIVESFTSPLVESRRREVLLRWRPTLRVAAVELAPEIRDEAGRVFPGSTLPNPIPHKHPMVKEDPTINRIAHREIKVRVRSDGRADGFHAGKVVTWSMEPLFRRPVEGGESGEPEFRGDWRQAVEGHRGRFEASVDFGPHDFHAIGQEQATTTVDETGHTAVRVNLPPVAFNAARILVAIAGEEIVELIDLEVPGIIVIDPGHGGDSDEPGSSANNATSHTSGVLEKELTLDFALRTQSALHALRTGENQNLEIHLTRNSDENLPGIRRARVGRDAGADILLSIHFNGFNGIARGTETLVRRRSDNANFEQDRALAERVNDAVYTVVRSHDEGARNRGIKEQQLAVLHDPSLGNSDDYHPLRSALLEVEFIDNQAVDELLNISEGFEQVRQDIADAIAGALIDDLRSNP